MTFGIRPEDVLLSETPKEKWIKARVTRSVIAIGGQLLFTLDVQGMKLKAKTRYREGLESLGEMWVDFAEGKVLLFGPDTERISLGGERLE
jgi:ABC-type sugar transport system ATPase subunit